MNRGEFLSSAIAAAATAHVAGTAAPVARGVTARATPKGPTYVPSSADPIPAAVLAHPIVGEARRYDGSTAPAGWILARGQTLGTASYGALYSVLGTIAGGNGTSTFRLPNPGIGMIVAYRGTFPSSPDAVRRTRPAMTAAVRVSPRLAAVSPQPAVPSVPDVPASRMQAAPMPRALRAEIAIATDRARNDAAAVLSMPTRACVTAAVEAAVRGETTLYAAVAAIEGRLSMREATDVVRVDGTFRQSFGATRTFADGAANRLEAARCLLALFVTRDQARLISKRELNASR